MCKDKGWRCRWNPHHSKTNDNSKDFDWIKDNDTIHLVLLDFDRCCYISFKLVRNAKIMRKEVGAYMNDEACETRDVWRKIDASGFVSWCNKKLAVDLPFSHSLPLAIFHIYILSLFTKNHNYLPPPRKDLKPNVRLKVQYNLSMSNQSEMAERSSLWSN